MRGLVRLLAIVLVAIVVLRLIVLLWLNSGRVGAGKLEGLDIHGRYYPIETVCPVIDSDAMEDGRDPCRPAGLVTEARTISVGGLDACRKFDHITLYVTVVDDNAEIQCSITAKDNAMVPALERVMLPQCASFIERLTHSRPITYAGGGFLTVR